MNIYRIYYDWCEGEHEETLLGKEVSKEKFEKDLIKAIRFAKSLIGKKADRENYLGKGYSVECLPEYYEQVIWFLINKNGYIECRFDTRLQYRIDDFSDKITAAKRTEKIEWKEMTGF
ncbi:MAG: hypothetical protein PHO02_01250 [Candidatus Nanoarchaeia archaeon]|nr:hypothetical protein [Candidatus Nanoarchaeia archaeon]